MKKWPSDMANHTICYKLLYIIQAFLIADIKGFGHTYVYLFAMLLLIGFTTLRYLCDHVRSSKGIDDTLIVTINACKLSWKNHTLDMPYC